MTKPNEETTKTIDSLLLQIDTAFSEVQCPPLESATDATHTWELDVFYENGVPQDWRDLSLDVLQNYRDTICLLEPEAFVFFYPAFMRCGLLEHRNENFEEVLWYCVRTLTYQHEELEQGKSLNQKTRLLSQEQKSVVRNFLIFAKRVFLKEITLADGRVFISDPEIAQLIDCTLQDTRLCLNQIGTTRPTRI